MTTSRKEAEKLLAQARADYEAALNEHQATEKAFDKEPSPELAERAAAQESKWRAYQRLVAVREKQLEEATKAEQEAARRKQIAELAEQHEKLRIRAREALRSYERACGELVKAVDVLKEVGTEADLIENKARGLGALFQHFGTASLQASCGQHLPKSVTDWSRSSAGPADLEAPRGLVDVTFARAYHTMREKIEVGESVITTRALAKRLASYDLLGAEPSDEPEAEAAE